MAPRISPQVSLRMIPKCLPESPFRDTVTRVVEAAIHMMDQQEQRITNLVRENQALNREIGQLRNSTKPNHHAPN